MAFRIHVTAIRSEQREKVHETFGRILGPGFAAVPLQQNAGWISFRTSVWGVRRGDLVNGLLELHQPALQFTTEDAARWYLTICMPDQEPETMVHEFGHHQDAVEEDEWCGSDEDDVPIDPELAFLEDEPVERQQPKTPFDRFAEQYSELGVPLPNRLVEQASRRSFDDAIKAFRQWQQDRLLGFLESAGVACDAEAVRRVLSWEGLTDAEVDSDLGNLPRLLQVIGLGGEWDRYVEEAEKPPPEVCEEEPAEPPPPWIENAERLTNELRRVEVEGGPVGVPVDRFHLVRFFAEACQVENDIAALVTVEAPKSSDRNRVAEVTPAVADYPRVEFARLPGGFRIGFENHLLVELSHIEEQLGRAVASIFSHPPDGTVLQCAFAADNEPATWQAYRGTVQGDVWQVDATDPAVPAAVLRDALKLAARASRTKHKVRDEAEAEAVMQAVTKDSYLHNMGVQRKGLVISCQYDVEFLAKILFRLRFRDYWNVEPVERHVEAEYQERIEVERNMRQAAVAMAREQMAPRLGEPIYRGRASTYWRSSLEHFRDLESEPRERFEQGMEKLKFTSLGDLTTKRFRDYVLRCYVSPRRLLYACLTASKYGYLAWEFISDLSDGSRLTTTTSPFVASRPAVKLYFKDYPGLGPEELYQRHLQLLGRFHKHKRTLPTQLVPSLVGLAKTFDDSIVRTDEDERENQ